MRKSIISLIGIPEEETQKNGRGEILKVKTTENSPDLMSDITKNGRIGNAKTLSLH